MQVCVCVCVYVHRRVVNILVNILHVFFECIHVCMCAHGRLHGRVCTCSCVRVRVWSMSTTGSLLAVGQLVCWGMGRRPAGRQKMTSRRREAGQTQASSGEETGTGDQPAFPGQQPVGRKLGASHTSVNFRFILGSILGLAGFRWPATSRPAAGQVPASHWSICR
jgi:hypothetical protein